jgi:predicted nucleic acid-binding protein
VRYWDTSAVVPLLVMQPTSGAVLAVLEQDRTMVAWWGTRVECVSAIARIEREASVEPDRIAAAFARLDTLCESWTEMQPGERLRSTAERLLRTHPLRAAGALQLAAAIVAADGDPRGLPFVTLDQRLARAAEREGFPVVEPA